MTSRPRRLRRPAELLRPTILLATTVAVLGLGLGSASALRPADDPYPPPVKDCTPAPSGKPPIERTRPPAALTPSTHRIVLDPGHSAKVRLQIVQPAQELDAFFLEDNGTKSEFTHCAFQGGLLWAATQLASERNLHVGLGNFGDYAGYAQLPSGDEGSLAPNGSGVYYLDSSVRPPDRTFFTDVIDLGNAWTGGWHATTGDQGGLEALYQAVTGAGQVIAPAHPDNIPAGAGAGFHPDAFPVVVMVAAHWFDSPTRTPSYPGVDFAPVVAALRGRGVNLAGVWLDNTNNKEANTGAPYDGLADLRSLVIASGTRTAAPLHCGGRQPTVPVRGLPLCVFIPPADMNSDIGGSAAPGQLGPVLHNLVDSLANPQPVSVRVLGGARVVAGLAGGARAGVNILLPHTFAATLTVRCTDRLASRTTPVKLSELVAGQPRASAALTVTCRRHRIPPAVHPLQRAAVFSPWGPAEPPAPVSQVQPNPAPAQQVQPQPAGQQAAQGAIAAGFGEQPEAVAEYARVPGQPGDAEKLWLGALAMSGLAGAALRWRHHAQPNHVT